MDLLFEKKKHIAYLTLNRPEKHNAINIEMGRLLREAWEEYRDDKNLRCAILTGKGKSFCSGADLGDITPLFTGAKKPQNEFEESMVNDPDSRGIPLLMSGWLHKPVVAAINGSAIAGGMEFLYGTDIRVASSEAKFGLQEVKWAVFPSGGSSVKLPRQMTYCQAMELMLTGELISAERALELGFVNKVVAPQNVMEEAKRYADIISKNGPLAVAAVKESVMKSWGKPLQEALQIEKDIVERRVHKSKDAREGPRAFKEKRPPIYLGE